MRYLICDICKQTNWKNRPIAGFNVCQSCAFKFWNSGILENKIDKEKRKSIVNYLLSKSDSM